MDKEKIMNQLQQKMEKTYLHTKIVEQYGALALKVEGEVIAWFSNWDPDVYIMKCGPELTEQALSNDILLNFYKEGRKLLKKLIKRYTVQIFPNERGYLCVDHESENSDEVSYSIGWPEAMYYLTQTQFTKSEIEELKKRDDIAIDWDKAEIEEADNGGKED